MTAAPLLRLQGLTRRFGAVEALRDVSFTIQPDEIVGLLGPNGAGKTTLIRVLCDLVRADAGTAAIAGTPSTEPAARRHLGVVTATDRSFFWRLNGYENLRFFAALQGLPARSAATRCRELLQRFGLDRHADRHYGTWSAGQKKRLALARALLHDPPILLMDEATDSLDAPAADHLIQLVREHATRTGRCVLWATHRLDEVERLCDRVLILLQGRLEFTGALTDFRSLLRDRTDTLIDATGCSEATLADVARDCGAEVLPGGRLRLPARHDPAALRDCLTRLLAQGATIREVHPTRKTLTEVFEHLSERQ